MKRLLSIALLGLLLYNTFGLAVAVLCFDQEFATAKKSENTLIHEVLAIPAPSLPYTTSWENEEGTVGLIKKDGEFYNVVHQKIENDTLFITLQSNTSARERFFELAGSMNDLSDSDKSKKSSSQRALKLLNDLVKSYLPIESRSELACHFIRLTNLVSFQDFAISFRSSPRSFESPPPELS
ncbi:hypothetical protein MUK70_25690 [Dyadobacter chenwenxiniae]|uniref:Uncharacterized protein n=1 Tax=Dyadobacter chenwenxiniae TaxID=2906456 RepID=A0A9X1TGR1_9BACT|nr:hypothetical protein [Dyadobacter chenwenxiniae]MCF0051089.1 hypothetical protein [Dyadobacter chenwenxiniae]MCF0064377.1 hypothetical protein [Dyadobacter chenwenxiniae]UON82416.1 hypothetical protein MUK70_25690 [Dyadobacter chenwenxiniae]